MQPSLQAGSVAQWSGTLDSTSPFGHNLPVTVGPGSNKTLILMVIGRGGALTVTFNSVAMTLLFDQPWVSGTVNSIYYLHNPPEGTFNAFVGVSSWSGAQCGISCSVWNDVDQAAAFGTPVEQSRPSSSSPCIATLTATDADVTLDAFSMYSGSVPVITNGQTTLFSQATVRDFIYGIASYKLGASTSVSNSWTGGSSPQSAQLSVVLKGAAGGGGTTHAATGSIASGPASVTGSAARSGGAVSHAATGALSAQAAALSSSVAKLVSGTFVSDMMVNNTGTVQGFVDVVWEWRKGTGIGVAPTSITYGTGTTSAAGVLTVTGLPAGAGELLFASTDRSIVAYQAGTVI